jgi:hypothetical protein
MHRKAVTACQIPKGIVRDNNIIKLTLIESGDVSLIQSFQGLDIGLGISAIVLFVVWVDLNQHVSNGYDNLLNGDWI